MLKRKIYSKIENYPPKNHDIHKAFVLSNERRVSVESSITYLPIYFVMFFAPDDEVTGEW